MTSLKDLALNIRTKNAGPFWVTADVFFEVAANYQRAKRSMAFTPESLSAHLQVSKDDLQIFAIDELKVIRFSFPRGTPQGGVCERDMHSGQRFVDFLEIDID